MLTDLEYRVWTQYILSADDFGVMLNGPSKLQADNRHLRNRPAKLLQRCLDALVEHGLVRRFEHQGQSYLCQHDWQDWQKVTWPSKTIYPCPPPDLLETFTEWTRLLFGVHPGAKKAPKKPEEKSSEELQSTEKEIPLSRAPARAERLTANGSGLVADGSEGVQGEPLDVAFRDFQERYPQARRKGGHLLEVAFVDQAHKAGGAAALMAALENHKASEQWANPRLIPGMDVWLREERWRQELPAAGAASSSANNPKTAGNFAAIQRFINRGGAA